MGEELIVDGKTGGGSILRIGVPLAIAHGRQAKFINVRKQRQRRGLQSQHLVGLELLCQITGSQLIGAAIGSSEFLIIPGSLEYSAEKHPQINIPSSAAVSLIVQTLSNYVFASRKPIGFDFVGGGSHVNFSPNFDVLTHVNKPLFELFGLRLHVQLLRPGFYPKGGATGRIVMEPIEFEKINLSGKEMESITVISHATSDLKPERVAEKQLQGFKSIIPKITALGGYADAVSSGFACSSVIKYDDGSVKSVARIGKSGMSASELGVRTANATKKIMDNGVSVDEQLADQLITPLAFCPSGSSYTFDKLYPHVKVNYEVVEQLLGHQLEITEIENGMKIKKI